MMPRLSAGALLIVLLFASHPAPAQETAAVRVGVLASEGKYDDWNRVLSDIESRTGGAFRFELAIGNYTELLYWMEEGWVDLAALNPAVFAISRDSTGFPDAAANFAYVATVGYPTTDPGAPEPYRHTYRSRCVVAAESSLRNLDDIRGAQGRGELRFLFGNPLSTSGRLAPETALREAGIRPTSDRIEFTQSHTNALEALIKADDGIRRVGFVYDGSLVENPELAAGVRVVPFPELDSMELPWDVVVARRSHLRFDELQALVLDYRDASGHRRFRPLENWRARYAAVRGWAQGIVSDFDLREGQPMTLDEVEGYLRHADRTQPRPPRLALVLSGGGARCSYQAGAIQALEERIAAWNLDHPEDPFDIDLVVGTSGGAINALPTAVGLSADPEGMQDFQVVWTSLDQREVIDLAPLVRASIGLWIGMLRIVILVVFLKLLIRRRETRAWWLGVLLVWTGISEGLLRWQIRVPWEWLGEDHTRHHLWLWISQGHDTSVILMGLTGVVILVLQAWRRRSGEFLYLSPRGLALLSLFLLVTLPMASGHHLLLGQETLSQGKGVERAMAEGMSYMIGRHAERTTGTPLQLDAEEPVALMRQMSRQVVERGLLRRDLVVTASCLEQSEPTIPDDLYFFLRSGEAGDPQPLGHRGIDLARYPDRLVEVVLGSGAIFPLFPARTLEDFPEPGHWVRIVDGGFAHNSPIEAAVLWGATHIILIEAGPEPHRGDRQGLAGNVITAVEHYARQTEQVDRRSSKEVVVFTLVPEEPHPCLLDFSDNILRNTIDKGYRDARGVVGEDATAIPRRRFVKHPGKPVFAPVGAE